MLERTSHPITTQVASLSMAERKNVCTLYTQNEPKNKRTFFRNKLLVRRSQTPGFPTSSPLSLALGTKSIFTDRNAATQRWRLWRRCARKTALHLRRSFSRSSVCKRCETRVWSENHRRKNPQYSSNRNLCGRKVAQAELNLI